MPLPKNKAKTAGRSKKGTNLYLDTDLVNWATEYAKQKHSVSLSVLVTRRLQRLKAEVERGLAAAGA